MSIVPPKQMEFALGIDASGLPDTFLYTDAQRRDAKIAAMQAEIDALKAQLAALQKRWDDSEARK